MTYVSALHAETAVHALMLGPPMSAFVLRDSWETTVKTVKTYVSALHAKTAVHALILGPPMSAFVLRDSWETTVKTVS